MDDSFSSFMFLGVVGGAVALMVRRMRRDLLHSEEHDAMLALPLRAITEIEHDTAARVIGRVAIAAPLVTAPFSGTPCAYYEAWCCPPGDNKVLWERTVWSPTFYLVDGEARALVRTPARFLFLGRTCRGRVRPQALPAALAEAIDDNTAYDWRTLKQLRWFERRIDPGARLTVAGAAHCEIDPDSGEGYRDLGLSVSFEPDRTMPLSISDARALLRAPRPRQGTNL